MPFTLSESLRAVSVLKETIRTKKKTLSYTEITDTLLGLALKVNKRVLTFCFGKSFGIEISLLLCDWFPGSSSTHFFRETTRSSVSANAVYIE